jgi:hypothetical protein
MATRPTTPIATNPDGVATLLGVSRVHVYTLIGTGDLPAADIRGPGARRPKYRILISGVERLLRETRRVKPLTT